MQMKHKINFILLKILKEECKQKSQNKWARQTSLVIKIIIIDKKHNYKKNNN